MKRMLVIMGWMRILTVIVMNDDDEDLDCHNDE